MPDWNYMEKQTYLSHSRRSILVDWLVEVGEEFKLQTETLFLTVSYIDRYAPTYLPIKEFKAPTFVCFTAYNCFMQ